MHDLLKHHKSSLSTSGFLVASMLFFGCHQPAPEGSKSWTLITEADTEEVIVRKAAQVVPTKRQMEWQRREFIAFVHFNLFTFARDSNEAGAELFHPKALDAAQWVQVCKDAGMKMLILTAKHHRGFCLWPSKYTEYSVESSPWKEGRGDVVREVADACREAGLEFGIYLSPWDMHEPSYGTPAYDEFFKNQLRELLTDYGPIAEVWFDGHYGGPKGQKHDYKWQEYYRLIWELQPDAVIAISGPDARWVGNEEGYARTSEWSVVPIAAGKQHGLGRDISTEMDSLFPQNTFSARAEDIGIRRKLLSQERPYYLVWYPAETDVSIRPSWVYRPEERPRSLDELLDIYYNSIGRNSVLLLNFAPDTRGLIPDEDIKRVQELRLVLDATFDENFAFGAEISASDEKEGHPAAAALDGDPETYWTTADGIAEPALELRIDSPKTFNRVVLQENIQVGQRCEGFVLQARNAAGWTKFSEGTTIGYKRILRTADITTDAIRLVITGSRASPTLGELGLYYQPPPGAIVNR